MNQNFGWKSTRIGKQTGVIFLFDVGDFVSGSIFINMIFVYGRS